MHEEDWPIIFVSYTVLIRSDVEVTLVSQKLLGTIPFSFSLTCNPFKH